MLISKRKHVSKQMFDLGDKNKFDDVISEDYGYKNKDLEKNL